MTLEELETIERKLRERDGKVTSSGKKKIHNHHFTFSHNLKQEFITLLSVWTTQRKFVVQYRRLNASKNLL